jgi:hypothetical protein
MEAARGWALALLLLACISTLVAGGQLMARQQVHNLWENGEKLEVYIYTSEDHEPFTNRGAMFAQGPLYHNTSVFGDSLSLKSAAPV